MALCLLAALVSAQEKPEVRVNVVNVCTPDEAASSEIAAALTHVPAKPSFGSDYEVARGRTTEKAGAYDWVRMRREFSGGTDFTNVQFLLSTGTDGIDETLVFHLRASEPGEALQISLDHQVTKGSAEAVLASNTPPSRIRIERFGKPSLVLARCPGADQKAYEPLFRTATERFATYREAMHVRAIAGSEIGRTKNAAASKH